MTGPGVKKLILDALSSERLLGLTAPLTRAHGIIFFAHRFADVERGSPGHDPEVLRQDLELLRRNKFNLTTLVDVVQHDRRVGQRRCRQDVRGELGPPLTAAAPDDDDPRANPLGT